METTDFGIHPARSVGVLAPLEASPVPHAASPTNNNTKLYRIKESGMNNWNNGALIKSKQDLHFKIKPEFQNGMIRIMDNKGCWKKTQSWYH